jgi:hypothetical protein
MSFATFSGPLRSGTVRFGDVTALNTGLPVLTQSANVASGVMTTSPTAQNLFTLPAGSKIIRFTVEKTTAISGGSVSGVNATFGKSGTADAFQTSAAIGLTTAQAVRATLDAALVSSAANNIGLTDVTVTGTFTAAGGNPTAGAAVVTVEYIQRNADGSTAPAYNNV